MAEDTPAPNNAPVPELRIRRPFNWGIVMLCDERSGSPPPPDPGRAVADEGGITVPVRHAQDADLTDLEEDEEPEPFEVEINCWRGPAPTDAELGGVGRIPVPSGRLTIGDAEHADVVEGTPGRWLVQVSGSSAQHPAHLDIWFTPGGPS